MATLLKLFIFFVVGLNYSCKQSNVVPAMVTTTSLSGSWLMTNKLYWTGDDLTVEAIPEIPKQILKFTEPNIISVTSIQDDVLQQAHYFDTVSTPITDSILVLKKDDKGSIIATFTYTITSNVLQIKASRGFGRYYGYNFSRI